MKPKTSMYFLKLSSQVAILFDIMRDKFDDEPRVQSGMDEVKKIIYELKSDVSNG